MTRQLTREIAAEAIAVPIYAGVCRVCGCTELAPCQDSAGYCCMWVDQLHTLCSSTRCIAAVPLRELETCILA